MRSIRNRVRSLYERILKTDRKRLLVIALIIIAVLSVAAGIYDVIHPAAPVTSITRREPGQGETEVMLDVMAQDQRYKIHVTVPERSYGTLELEEIFERGEQWIRSHYLGNNPDSEHISDALSFAEMIPETGINIRWEPQDYRLIRSDGAISEEALLEAPVDTAVTAVLSYGEEKREILLSVTIVPREKKIAGIAGIIDEKLEMLKGDAQDEKQFILPREVSGVSLTWYRQKTHRPVKIFLAGAVIVSLLYLSGEEKKLQKRKERIKGLDQDYPEIVYQMVLLIGSGSTVRAAWEKMIADYEKQKMASGCERPGFEEMAGALKEMHMGIPEIKAYENFGRRCARRSYIRFSALIVQQIRRGAGGMSEIMMQEVTESEVMWRENARRSAEEAGMKLLMPLVMLMAVVFAVMVIPAFLSMNM